MVILTLIVGAFSFGLNNSLKLLQTSIMIDLITIIITKYFLSTSEMERRKASF